MPVRDRQVYVSRAVYHSLRMIGKAKDKTVDEVADKVLADWLMSQVEAAQIWLMYQRHESEEQQALEAFNATVKGEKL